MSAFEDIVHAIHALVDDPGLAYGVLRLAQDEHVAARHVTWIPLTFETRPRSHTGPIPHPQGAPAMYEERWNVEAHIIGDGLEDAETIRTRILAAAREALGANSEPTGGIWVTQAMGESAHSYGGLEKIVQRFAWHMYVFAPVPSGPSTVVQHVDTTPEMPPGSPSSGFTQSES